MRHSFNFVFIFQWERSIKPIVTEDRGDNGGTQIGL